MLIMQYCQFSVKAVREKNAYFPPETYTTDFDNEFI